MLCELSPSRRPSSSFGAPRNSQFPRRLLCATTDEARFYRNVPRGRSFACRLPFSDCVVANIPFSPAKRADTRELTERLPSRRFTRWGRKRPQRRRYEKRLDFLPQFARIRKTARVFFAFLLFCLFGTTRVVCCGVLNDDDDVGRRWSRCW